MLQLPGAAVGAVIAALIAGIVSLLGLIISKEQKTSEFRQSWIDALRTDLSAFLTQINAIQDAIKVPYGSHAEKVRALAPLYLPLNTSTFNILLRVNPVEAKSKRLLNAMEGFNALTIDEAALIPGNIRPVEAEFLVASQELLKSEWRRVKAGEVTFQVAKITAFLVVVASAAVVMIVATVPVGSLSKARPVQREPSTHPKAALAPASPSASVTALKPNSDVPSGEALKAEAAPKSKPTLP